MISVGENDRIVLKGATSELVTEMTAVMAGVYSILKKDFSTEAANQLMTASLFLAIDNATQDQLGKCEATDDLGKE